MTVEVGATVDVVTERPATGGAVAHLDDGRVAFVRLALSGERVNAVITEVRRNFVRAEVVTVLAGGEGRVSPPCQYAVAGQCGGCDLQHASTEAQLEWKAAIVLEHLRRIAGFETTLEVSVAPSAPRGSRTRLRCGVGADGRLGLRRAASRDIVGIDACWLADDRLAGAFSHVWTGAAEVELRAIGTGEPFCVVHAANSSGTHTALTSLNGDPLTSARSVAVIGAHRFEIGPRSFWQSHCDAPEILSAQVVDALGAGAGDRVVDLYSGVGLFAVPIAAAVGPTGRVDAVESSAAACSDLRRNARGLDRLRVREWQVTPRAVNDLVYNDSLVVLDPPRSGAGSGVMTALTKRRPRRIVYVSCDAATFARDLKEIAGGGYQLTSLRAYDLFPMTEHVELVGVLDAPS